ncbi:hypothetical protein [Candidatus Bathycorpusculum sp.]|jgi:hypothetical protein|uniref:hypothetical protein n=1 Tax=Candidatus Bathycorpusculum sp. TaxID=2994959 RepID=UPI00281AF4E5|nr:hypothetical protein [Candidatus Termitimicrobium sp.]MCL2686250.1 hypothetical protein [Candidatus Termitimicrobium sp.]
MSEETKNLSSSLQNQIDKVEQITNRSPLLLLIIGIIGGGFFGLFVALGFSWLGGGIFGACIGLGSYYVRQTKEEYKKLLDQIQQTLNGTTTIA